MIKLEKSLCVRDKAEDLCLMPWSSGPQMTLHHSWHDSVIDITKWAQEYYQKPLSVNTIRRANSRCLLELYHAKRKPYVNMVQKCRRVLLAKANLTWTVSKCKSVLWSDESKFDILVGNHRHLVLRLKRRETFQHVISVQFKSQHLWCYGVHKCIWYGQLWMLKGI